MPKQILTCSCRPGYKCPALLHGEIEIVSCSKNCGLGCANSSGKRRKRKQ